jgi:hypothetical protein
MADNDSPKLSTSQGKHENRTSGSKALGTINSRNEPYVWICPLCHAVAPCMVTATGHERCDLVRI